MDFDPTDEQRMLAETVNSLLDKRYDPASRLKLLDSELGWSRELWQQYAQLGLLGLTFDEQYDGAGMGGAELATVMESFGRSLVLEPFFATVVLGGTLVSQAGTPEQKAAILPKVAAGELLLAFAYAEPGTRWSQTDIATTAVRSRGLRRVDDLGREDRGARGRQRRHADRQRGDARRDRPVPGRRG